MIRVNGIPLDNPKYGWVFRPGSMPYSGIEPGLTQVPMLGRDGHYPTPYTRNAPLMTFVVNTSPANLQTLLALFSGQTLTLQHDSMPGKSATARLVSATPEKVFGRNQWIDVSFIVELPGVYWRDLAETNVSFNVSGTSTAVEFWTGISAPVQDALVRGKGPHSGMSIYDPSGAWLALPGCAASESIVFDMATGIAGKNTNGSWDMVTDVSGQIDFGGPRGVFEITPQLDPADPAIRKARLSVTGSSILSGSTFAIRGKAAYML